MVSHFNLIIRLGLKPVTIVREDHMIVGYDFRFLLPKHCLHYDARDLIYDRKWFTILITSPFWSKRSNCFISFPIFRTNLTGLSAGMCASSFHPNSLEKSCDDSGHRRVDWFGLTFVFLGIVLTGVGNSVFYSFGIAYLVSSSSRYWVFYLLLSAAKEPRT